MKKFLLSLILVLLLFSASAAESQRAFELMEVAVETMQEFHSHFGFFPGKVDLDTLKNLEGNTAAKKPEFKILIARYGRCLRMIREEVLKISSLNHLDQVSEDLRVYSKKSPVHRLIAENVDQIVADRIAFLIIHDLDK